MSSLISCTGHKTLLPPITSAYRESLFDAKGNEYFDLEAGVWSLSLGHNHEHIETLLSDRKNTLLHSGFIYSSDVVEQAAPRICAFAGLANGACLFLSSGSEAMEFALQVGAAIGQDTKLVTLPKAYFGSYSRTNQRDDTWLELPQTMEEFEQTGGGCPDKSVFLFEPGSTSGEVRFHDPKYVQKIANQVQVRDGIVVANEVTTGMGRTGKNCAYEHYGITPDIVVMGKGIGNGFPVSAVVVSKPVAEKLAASTLKYMQSHQNDPFSAMIALCVIDTIENEELVAQAAEKGEILLKQLKRLELNDVVAKIRGKGLMIAVEFRSTEECARIHHGLINAGFVTTNRGNMIRLDPPLNVKPQTLQRFSNCLANLVKTLI